MKDQSAALKAVPSEARAGTRGAVLLATNQRTDIDAPFTRWLLRVIDYTPR